MITALGLVHGLAGAAEPPAASARPSLVEARELDKFVQDYPRFVAWARERGEGFDRLEAGDQDFEELFGEQATTFLDDLGWSMPRFSYVLTQVVTVLAGLKMEQDGAKVTAVLEAERIDILNHPRLTPEQRRDRLAKVEESLAEMKRLQAKMAEVDPAELALIKARREKLLLAFAGLYHRPGR